tara:strand:+ start:905 stop:1174 length:270 start_codon:yes stop_codon:yes gene_type:complete
LNTEAKELIRAAINPPATKPFKPAGKSVLTSIGNALSDFSIENRLGSLIDSAKAIIPGIKKINIGNNFKYAPKITPLLPILILFAASVL